MTPETKSLLFRNRAGMHAAEESSAPSPAGRILFLTPYPFDTAPSQRFRHEQYLGALARAGVEYDIRTFLDDETYDVLYQKGMIAKKALGVARGFLRRFKHLYEAGSYDRVFVHRELAPIGPPIFEWVLAKLLRRKMVYDFDDAIWLPNTSEHNRVAARLKWHKKVASICRWAHKVSCGNEYLCEYARRYCRDVVLSPTTIDTDAHHNRIKNQATEKVVIGWTGTHSTIGYLEQLVPVLRKLEEDLDFEFVVISNRAPDFELRSLVYKEWRKETEIDDLITFNLGVMPLSDDPWARGKCGFKALQYMALGMPAVASPVGVNTAIITHGVDGYLCNTPEEWEAALRRLVADEALRVEMGRRARQTVIERYSVSSNTANFLSLLA